MVTFDSPFVMSVKPKCHISTANKNMLYVELQLCTFVKYTAPISTYISLLFNLIIKSFDSFECFQSLWTRFETDFWNSYQANQQDHILLLYKEHKSRKMTKVTKTRHKDNYLEKSQLIITGLFIFFYILENIIRCTHKKDSALK